ncbi:MAG: CoA transferase [Alphaproteobacteria bacterium]|nr:CoA transferase [Alphaproteobacteria bacterium]
MAKAFENIRVADFSQVLAGPFATQQLALLGADVIKVEVRGSGDQARGMLTSGAFLDKRMAPLFMSVNAGKRSITLDLKHERAAEIVHRLVKDSDVFIQNFKAGVVDRLGFGYEAIKAINPSIVYCSISGYGQEGPRSGAAAYDSAIQAASGMTSTTGFPENGPTRIGFTVVDMTTGITAAYAIASALFRREVTGEGQFLDVAMLDSALTQLGPLVANFLNAGTVPTTNGNSSITGLATAEQFKTKEGYILTAVLLDNQVRGLFTALGRPGLIEDPRFATDAARKENYSALRAILDELFLADTAANWVPKLAEVGAPASEILTVPQAVAQPQLAHRNVLLDLPAPQGLDERVRTVGAGFQSPVDTPSADVPPPGIGEHTDAILAELGYDAKAIASLRADEVV